MLVCGLPKALSIVESMEEPSTIPDAKQPCSFLLFTYGVVLRVEPWSLCMPGKRFISELRLQLTTLFILDVIIFNV